jgi:hypothetical protein
MEKKNFSKNNNYSINSQNTSSSTTNQKEDNSIFPSLSSIWEDFVGMFTQNDNVNNNNNKKEYNNDQYCKCNKTKSKDYCDSIYEILQMTKNNTINKRSKELYENLLKVHEKSLDINGDNLRQIKKDLNRTYPSTTLFKKERILNKLKNVLRAFSNYDNTIKYFQGMNFIVGFFLYHCDEYVAFWLFVSLIEEYDLRKLFMEGFPGLNLHVHRVELILQNEYLNIWEIFQKIGVKVEIFMVEWLFSLFSSLIPLELQIYFYKGFFSQGWYFFYKMAISSILNLKGGFIEADEIYIGIKCGKNEDNVKEEEIKNTWKKIIQKAYSLKIKTDIMSINK